MKQSSAIDAGMVSLTRFIYVNTTYEICNSADQKPGRCYLDLKNFSELRSRLPAWPFRFVLLFFGSFGKLANYWTKTNRK